MVFEKIKNLFFKSNSAQNVFAEDDLLSLDNPSFITEPDKIVRVINEIERTSPLCTIVLPDNEQEYTSSIIGIQIDQNALLFDEISPKEGNELLKVIKKAKLLAYYKGVRITFNMTNIQMSFSRGIAFYKCPLPDRIYYPQRRRAHRIEVPSLNIPFNGIAQKSGLSVNGNVYDLSRAGIGILLPIGKMRFQRGDYLERCQISFDDYAMDFDLDLRFTKLGPVGTGKMQLGGVFQGVSPRSLNKLSYFVSTLERLEIRKQKA